MSAIVYLPISLEPEGIIKFCREFSVEFSKNDKEKSMAEGLNNQKVVVLSSITSDIGIALARRFAHTGWTIVGSYRSEKLLGELTPLTKHLYYCDLSDKQSIEKFTETCKTLNIEWDLFISCTGTQKPIGLFFNCDFDRWSDSLHINAIEQLRVLHGIYALRKKGKIVNAMFFAGPGTNNAVSNYTAYAISKIILIKMCEFIDFETPDLNIFIAGPGWTKTKMHYETINESRENVGENYDKTVDFMQNAVGTSMDDIFDCIVWLCEQGKEIASGRNFSVVYDAWKGEHNKKLIEALKSDRNMYKLRRCKNDFMAGS